MPDKLSALEREAIRQMGRKQEKKGKRFRKAFEKETGKKYRAAQSPGKKLMKECDEIWTEIIKKRARLQVGTLRSGERSDYTYRTSYRGEAEYEAKI